MSSPSPSPFFFFSLSHFRFQFLVCARLPWRLLDAECVMEGCGEALLSSWHLLCPSQIKPIPPPFTPLTDKGHISALIPPSTWHHFLFASCFLSVSLLQFTAPTVLLRCSPLLCQTRQRRPHKDLSSIIWFLRSLQSCKDESVYPVCPAEQHASRSAGKKHVQLVAEGLWINTRCSHAVTPSDIWHNAAHKKMKAGALRVKGHAPGAVSWLLIYGVTGKGGRINVLFTSEGDTREAA